MTLHPFIQKLADQYQHQAMQKKIILSEGEDPRIIEAGLKAAEHNIAHIILVGDEKTIKSQLTSHPSYSHHQDKHGCAVFPAVVSR